MESARETRGGGLLLENVFGAGATACTFEQASGRPVRLAIKRLEFAGAKDAALEQAVQNSGRHGEVYLYHQLIFCHRLVSVRHGRCRDNRRGRALPVWSLQRHR